MRWIRTSIVIIAVMLSGVVKAQADTSSVPGFAFPMYSQMSIRLIPIDSVRFHYTILNYDLFDEKFDLEHLENYTNKKAAEGTIEILVSIGTKGTTEEEKKANKQSVFIIRNGTEYPLEFSLDIQKLNQTVYEPVAVMPVIPHGSSVEMWDYSVEMVGLFNFMKLKSE